MACPSSCPLGAHGQRIFAHRDGHAQRRAQLQPHGFHRGVQRGVFAGLAASGHPVGRELDARQLDRRGQQIGDGLGHRHPARGGCIDSGQRRALAHAHGLAGKAGKIGQGHRAVGHRHLPGAHHLVAMAQAAHGAVANGDQKALRRHGGAGQHRDTGLLQGDAVQVQRRKLPLQAGHVAVHLGRLAQQHIHGHIDWQVCWLGSFGIAQHQLALLGGHPHHRKRAALALAQRAEQHQRIRGNRQHIALLALVAPDLLGRHAAFLQRHSAQVKPRATAGIVGQLRKSVGQATSANVVDRQNRVAQAAGATVQAQRPTLVDDLLRPALDLRVAALHRIKIQLGRVGASGHRTRRAAAHANAHARAAQLNQQAAGRKRHLVRLRRHQSRPARRQS